MVYRKHQAFPLKAQQQQHKPPNRTRAARWKIGEEQARRLGLPTHSPNYQE